MKAIPEIPQEILDAIDSHELNIFVGAGLSKLFGYPLWKQLADNLITKCLDYGVMSRSQQAVLKEGNFTPMQLVTISFKKIEKDKGIDTARMALKEELEKPRSADEKLDVDEIANYLANYRSTIITTNADLSLDSSASFNGKNIVDDFSSWDKKDEELIDIFHLHGSINDVSKMIFTSYDYAKSYMVGADFGDNLSKLIKEGKTFLFIGYGVAEFELIRYFLRANNEKKNNLFMLSGYLEKDEIKRNFDQEYFESLGITVVPYSLETKGYFALRDVLKEWDESVRTKTLAHLKPIKQLEFAFNNRPTDRAYNLIERCLSEGKLKYVVHEMTKSRYISEWILRLKNNRELFSIENIKPCEIIDQKRWRSSTWEGLMVIKKYAYEADKNSLVDDFVEELLKQSIDRYIHDVEHETLKRLDSSHVILEHLRRILFSNARFLDACDSESFMSIYINAEPFSLYSAMKDLKILSSLTDKRKCFSIVKLFVENKKVSDGAEFITGDAIENVIKQDAIDFYKYSLGNYEESNGYYFDMGSFYDYPSSESLLEQKNGIVIDWIKRSSKYVDFNVLKKDVERLIHSDKEHHQKCGLALININLDRFFDVFRRNADLFFENRAFYSDIYHLFDINIDLFLKRGLPKEQIIEWVTNAEWGYNNSILKNHIFGMLQKHGFEVDYCKESKKELEISVNANKSTYMVTYSLEDDAIELHKKIKDLNFDEAISFYKNNLSNSSIFADALTLSLLKYFEMKGLETSIKYLPNFEVSMLKELILKFDESDNGSAVLEVAKEIRIRNLEEAYATVIYIAQKKARNNEDLFNVRSLLDTVDYEHLNLQDIQTDSVIESCINNDLFMFLDLYCLVAQSCPEAFEKVKQIVTHLKKALSGKMAKAIIAYVSPRLIYIDKEYGLKQLDYAFDNPIKDINSSYVMFSLSGLKYPDAMSHLTRRDDFDVFLSNHSDNQEVKRAQTDIAINMSYNYLSGDVTAFNHLESFMKAQNYDGVENIVKCMVFWQKERPLPIDKINDILSLVDKQVNSMLFNNDFKSDYLLSSLAGLEIVTDNNLPIIWKMMERLFDLFDCYFSKELFSLFERFKDIESDNVSKLMDKYVEKYDEDMVFEDEFRKVLRLFASDPNYHNNYLSWRTKVASKNPYFSF